MEAGSRIMLLLKDSLYKENIREHAKIRELEKEILL